MREYAFNPNTETSNIKLPNAGQPRAQTEDPDFDHQLDEYFDTKTIDASTHMKVDPRLEETNQ